MQPCWRTASSQSSTPGKMCRPEERGWRCPHPTPAHGPATQYTLVGRWRRHTSPSSPSSPSSRVDKHTTTFRREGLTIRHDYLFGPPSRTHLPTDKGHIPSRLAKVQTCTLAVAQYPSTTGWGNPSSPHGRIISKDAHPSSCALGPNARPQQKTRHSYLKREQNGLRANKET